MLAITREVVHLRIRTNSIDSTIFSIDKDKKKIKKEDWKKYIFDKIYQNRAFQSYSSTLDCNIENIDLLYNESRLQIILFGSSFPPNRSIRVQR